MPTRRAPPACGSSSTSSSWARSRWSPRRDSTSVIARAIARRSPRQHPVDERRRRRPVASRHQWPRRSDSVRSSSCAASAMTVPGQEHRGRAHLLERRHVVGRDDPADHDQHVVGAELGQRVPQRRHQREVAGGERVDADDVHVGLDRLPGDLLGRLEQRPDVDVEAEVGERGGDHLLAAVVAVLAHLGDQDAGTASLGLLELLRPCGGPPPPARAGPALLRFVAVHTGDGAHLPGVPAVDLLQRVGDLPDGRLRPGGVDGELEQVRVQPAAPPSLGGRAGRVGEPAQRVASRPSASRSARSCSSLAFCWASTSALSTLSTSICLVGRDPVLVDADHRLPAGVDPRLGAGGGLLDAQLRDAVVDRLGHAAVLGDLLDVRPRRGGPGRRSASRRRPSRPTGR